jgi:hypothetical protein
MKKVIVKLNEREEILKYLNVKTLEIIDGFLVITHKPNSTTERGEPISLSIINYWDVVE